MIDEETAEGIEELMAVAKGILKIYTTDSEFFELQAKHCQLQVDAYIAKGFSRSEAIQMICASFQSLKK